MKYSVLAVAAAGVSASQLFSRQDIGSAIESQLGNLPSQCQSPCQPLIGAVQGCGDEATKCLEAICQPDVLSSYSTCLNCVIDAAGDVIDDATKQQLQGASGQLDQSCAYLSSSMGGGGVHGPGYGPSGALGSTALGSGTVTGTAIGTMSAGEGPSTPVATPTGTGPRSGGGPAPSSTSSVTGPSGSAAAANPSNAAVGGAQVGMGAGVMAAVLGMVAAAL